jgi:hypothetical protein
LIMETRICIEVKVVVAMMLKKANMVRNRIQKFLERIPLLITTLTSIFSLVVISTKTLSVSAFMIVYLLAIKSISVGIYITSFIVRFFSTSMCVCVSLSVPACLGFAVYTYIDKFIARMKTMMQL